ALRIIRKRSVGASRKERGRAARPRDEVQLALALGNPVSAGKAADPARILAPAIALRAGGSPARREVSVLAGCLEAERAGHVVFAAADLIDHAVNGHDTGDAALHSPVESVHA